jgi:cellulose synthase (UDP-forming)
VPYLPTPKDDKPKNNLLLSLPNILVVLISGLAIIYNYYNYGRNVFWHPFNLIMVGFAITNMVVMGTIAVFSQEKLIEDIRAYIRKCYSQIDFEAIPRYYYALQGKIQKFVVRYPLIIGISIFALTNVGLVLRKSEIFTVQTHRPIELRNQQHFFMGLHLYDLATDSTALPHKLVSFKTAVDISLNKISIYQPFDPACDSLPEEFLARCYRNGIAPLITWDPGTLPFAENFLDSIKSGKFDAYLSSMGGKMKKLGFPVYIRFAPEADDLNKNWGLSPDHDDEINGKKFTEAWRHVVHKFREQRTSNVRWVWNPGSYYFMNDFYPGREYVDYIGISVLNYGRAARNGTWHSFAALYEPFRHEIAKTKRISMMYKPVIITEFGATSYGGRQDVWMDEALYNIMEYYPEIRGIIFYTAKEEKIWKTNWRPDLRYDFADFSYSDSARVISTLRGYMKQPPFKNTRVLN